MGTRIRLLTRFPDAHLNRELATICREGYDYGWNIVAECMLMVFAMSHGTPAKADVVQTFVGDFAPEPPDPFPDCGRTPPDDTTFIGCMGYPGCVP